MSKTQCAEHEGKYNGVKVNPVGCEPRRRSLEAILTVKPRVGQVGPRELEQSEDRDHRRCVTRGVVPMGEAIVGEESLTTYLTQNISRGGKKVDAFDARVCLLQVIGARRRA